jgi:DNA adenine methylase
MLYKRLSAVLFDECRRDESIAALKSAKDPIDRAFHWFIIQWFGRNGFSGTVGDDKSSFAVRWTPNGGHGGQRFASAVDSIPPWHYRMRRVTILNRDGFGVLESIDDNPKTSIYIDPPYIKKNAHYTHDFASSDHERLAISLRRFVNARVVISYYDHPEIHRLYPLDDWSIIDCSRNKGLHNAGRRGQIGKLAPEILIVNGDPFTQLGVA